MIRRADLVKVFTHKNLYHIDLQLELRTAAEALAWWENGAGMIVTQLGDRLILQTPAKVNLHLEVLGKRQDGYHELESLIVAIDLYDVLEFREIPTGTEFTCDDPKLGMGEDNLVVRAARRMREQSGVQRGVAIHLQKRIPAQAGLAGGSSDAAATLVGLNTFWGLGWSTDRLAGLGAELGSDVPFFFHLPAAIARGRGEKLTAVRMGRPLDLVVVYPREGLSTARVFGQLRVPDDPQPVAPIAQALEQGETERVAKLLHNRLEEVSLSLSRELAAVHRDAATWDCLGHRMSGSGTAYFAICQSAARARSLCSLLKARGLGTCLIVNSCQ